MKPTARREPIGSDNAFLLIGFLTKSELLQAVRMQIDRFTLLAGIIVCENVKNYFCN